MEFTHSFLLGVMVGGFSAVVGGLIAATILMRRKIEKDEAIDAAIFLAQRELRERFEQFRASSSR
jgi:hypothetical protein